MKMILDESAKLREADPELDVNESYIQAARSMKDRLSREDIRRLNQAREQQLRLTHHMDDDEGLKSFDQIKSEFFGTDEEE